MDTEISVAMINSGCFSKWVISDILTAVWTSICLLLPCPKSEKGCVCVCVCVCMCFLEWHLMSSRICLQEIYLSWEMSIWVTHIFSLFSHAAASCWLQVVLLFIWPLVHLFAMRILRRMGRADYSCRQCCLTAPLLSWAGLFQFSSLSCSHKLFFCFLRPLKLVCGAPGQVVL